MNKFIALCAALFLLVAPASAQDDPTGYRYVAERLARGVHLLRQREPFHVQPRGNVAVIEQRGGVVLVDSGGSSAAAEEVIAFVRSRTDKPVTAVIFTHWHGDHVLGASRLLQEWPQARLIATEATRSHLALPSLDRFMPGEDADANAALQRMIAGGLDYFSQQAEDAALSARERTGFAAAVSELRDYGEEMAHSRRVVPTEGFAHALTLPDRRTPVEARFIGAANTDGDAVVWLPRQRVLITGDIVVSPVPYGFGSAPGAWIETLTALKAYDFAVLAPGHGLPMRDAAYLDRLIALLTTLRAQIAPLAAENVTPSEAAARIDLSAQRAGFVGDDPWLARWFDSYFTNAIIPSALKEARGEPIAQVSD